MNKPKLIIENGKHVGEVLLDELFSAGIINESRFKILSASEILTEATNTNKHVFYKSRKTGTQRHVERNRFAAVYSDIRQYQTHEDIAAALGFVMEDFGEDPQKRKAVLSKFINRTLVKGFNKSALPEDEKFPPFDKRNQFYSGQAKEAGDDWEFGDPTIEDIDGGSRSRRGKETRTLQKINSQDLLDGEFYSNMTRIPKSRWGSWLRFWDRKKSSVAQDKSLFGREWGKSFILGYQVEQNLLYEIWYNSIDSTFTVHDKNGTEMSGRVKTISEAIRNLISQVAQTSTSDAEVFRGNTPQSRQLAQSIQRSLYQDMDQRAEELQRLEKQKQKEARAGRIKEISRRREAQRTAEQNAREFAKTFKGASPSEVGSDPQNPNDDLDQEDSPKSYNIKGDPTRAQRDKMDKTMADYEQQEKRRREKMDKQSSEERIKRVVDDIPSTSVDSQKSDLERNYGVEVPEFVSKADKKKIERERKRREKEAKKRSKGVSKSGEKTSETSAERQARIRREIEQSRKKTQDQIDKDKSRRSVKENFDIEMGDDDPSLEDSIQAKTDNSRYDAQIRKIREDAERSPYTQMALKQTAGGLVNYYTSTRVNRNFSSNVLIRNMGRGRSEKIALPTDKPSIWERTKMAFQGTRYRADFIIGWSLAEKVNLEIWYITEPHPEYTGKQGQQKTLASFYIFDVSSGTLVRSYIPYYRQAIQIVMSKINAF